MKKSFLYITIVLIASTVALPQVDQQTQKYRSDPVGSKLYRKRGILDGNLIRTLYQNDGQIGYWEDRPSIEWPKGSDHHYSDGCTPVISTRLTAPGNKQTVYFCQTSYREEVDKDLVTGQYWVMEPVPGYAFSSSEEPAISTKPFTWPEQWPRVLPLITPEWDGYWFGYFGRGVQNADVESFFVMDDSQDREWLRPPYSYYPIFTDSSRGGLGLRMEVRGFQWSHVLAEDIIFWHFDIFNLSDADYDSTFFGFYSDTGIGGLGDNGDDNAYYDTFLDLAYAFDADGFSTTPTPRWKTGYMGYAFLESPGNPFNGVNDDEDKDIFGADMTDERRDDGIDNDKDWVSFLDINSNGVWDADENEPLNNDVGNDGVGPFDPQYNGPDPGEGDGVPTAGEPNFDATDKDESDQIGLTSLAIERLSNKGPTAIWPKNDNVIWNKMQPDTFDVGIQNANIQILFGSGPFPLKKGLRERFSVAIVMGSDIEDMVFNKETVQQIYNANYNFTKPPYKATLTAVPGDKKVFLFWDAVAEESRDPFLGFEQDNPTLGYKKDFEGYMIYRSQEAEFEDIKIITDSKGEPKYWKPIAQFDLKDGIKGPDPIGINGAHFWRGSDNGLQHSYIDTNVVNGQKYYYALVAYDQGDPNLGTKGLVPSETTKIISVDLVGNLQFVDINCAVVTPNAPIAGYLPAEISGSLDQVTDGQGTGYIDVTILNQGLVVDGAKYKVEFDSAGTVPYYKTVSSRVIRELNSKIDTVIAKIDSSNFGGGQLSPMFDGIAISIYNTAVVNVDQKNTGWLKGFSTLYMPVIVDTHFTTKTISWPSNYELNFVGSYSELSINNIPVNFTAKNASSNYPVQVWIYDNDNNKQLTLGDQIGILEKYNNQSKYTYLIGYYPPIDIPFTVYPVDGDIFKISSEKPFMAGDYFNFATKAAAISNEQAKLELDNIKVVPNPYIATNVWEPRQLSSSGRGERRIDFIHLPSKCTIRIYTSSGSLVKTLNKESSPLDGSISWNLVSEDGMDVAYGLYIYHVDAPDIGEKIGKFALIK
jgi:hypothetical protein